MGIVASWIRNLFWSQEMEIAIVGLQNAGKSTYVQVLNTGEFQENLIPTVGFNMHKVQKNRCTIKVWDLGGQDKFRQQWGRYCKGVNAIVYIIDSADEGKIEEAHDELKVITTFSRKPHLNYYYILVLGSPGKPGVERNSSSCSFQQE